MRRCRLLRLRMGLALSGAWGCSERSSPPLLDDAGPVPADAGAGAGCRSTEIACDSGCCDASRRCVEGVCAPRCSSTETECAARCCGSLQCCEASTGQCRDHARCQHLQTPCIGVCCDTASHRCRRYCDPYLHPEVCPPGTYCRLASYQYQHGFCT